VDADTTVARMNETTRAHIYSGEDLFLAGDRPDVAHRLPQKDWSTVTAVSVG
jgi:hypothetical protein